MKKVPKKKPTVKKRRTALDCLRMDMELTLNQIREEVGDLRQATSDDRIRTLAAFQSLEVRLAELTQEPTGNASCCSKQSTPAPQEEVLPTFRMWLASNNLAVVAHPVRGGWRALLFMRDVLVKDRPIGPTFDRPSMQGALATLEARLYDRSEGTLTRPNGSTISVPTAFKKETL